MTTHRLKLYILDDLDRPTPEPDFLKWATWMGTTNRQVAEDKIAGHRVSTIFSGIDPHTFDRGAFAPNPALWETMVFAEHDSSLDRISYRCPGSREQALAMHARTLEHVRATVADTT